jgi:hypothetical protein
VTRRIPPVLTARGPEGPRRRTWRTGARRLGQGSERSERSRVCARPQPLPGRVRRHAQKSRDELQTVARPPPLVAARHEHPPQCASTVHRAFPDPPSIRSGLASASPLHISSGWGRSPRSCSDSAIHAPGRLNAEVAPRELPAPAVDAAEGVARGGRHTATGRRECTGSRSARVRRRPEPWATGSRPSRLGRIGFTRSLDALAPSH